MLKDFCWSVFETMGSIDAYILYKDIPQRKGMLNEVEADITEQEVAISQYLT